MVVIKDALSKDMVGKPVQLRGWIYRTRSSGGIVFAVLYLGVHWLADVFGGFVLAVGATLLASNEKVLMTIDRQVRKVSEKLVGEEESSEGPT